MSAFYDIWIGDSVPLHVRNDNEKWVHKDLDIPYWISLPQSKSSFINEISTTSHQLVVIGQLYEEINLNTLLARCIAHTEGAKSFNDPAGHYILFLFDKLKKEYHVFTNRLGTYHAYWQQGSGSNVISTYYLGMAKQAINKSLDWKAITGYMGMGFFPEDSTYLQSIKVFKPASHYCFNEKLELLHSERYWQWSHTPTNDSVKENTAKFDAILASSIRTAVNNQRVALPISGGLDSRVLAGKLAGTPDLKTKIWSFSYGYSKTSIETQIANSIADKRKIPFEHYVVPNYLFDKIDTITGAVELFQYVDGTRQACMQDELAQRSDVVVGGHWGDVWMDDMGIDVSQGANEEEVLLSAFRKKIVKKGSSWLLKEVCDPYFKNGHDYLDSYFTGFIDQYKYIQDPDFRMKIFKTDQWSFRWTLASIRMYQAGSFPVLPFYDKRIVDLFTTIPTQQVKGRHLEIEYLKEYHPDLAKIKWQEYNSNLYNYKWLNNRNIIYRIVKKIQRILSPGITIARNWEIFYLNDEGRKNLERELLNPEFNKIVAAEKINEILAAFYKNPTADKGYTVSMLLTFAEFIKKVM